MEASNQVEKFDPSKLMDGVKDRIKATFVSLIPEDAWAKMVQEEIDRFFKQDQSWDKWNSTRNNLSPFQTLIQNELNIEVKKRMNDYLSGPDFQVTWDRYGNPIAQNFIKNMIIENSGAVLSNMYAGMAAGMLQNFKNSINNFR